MKITFIGAGNVGAALAVRLAEAGHEVALAETREGSGSVAKALERSARLTAKPLEEAVAGAEAVFLATPFGANEGIVRPLADALAGKVLVDCTNPVGPGLSHGLESKRSGSEVLQSIAPGARVVKAFTIYGYENLDDPRYPAYAVKPAMLFCGDEAAAKESVAKLIADCGFEPVDVGGLIQALHLEHMTLLWVRMVRAGKQSPHLVWAALRR
ncbi:MAG: NADPH-dependent F420 reductase [Polyangiales bacterium]